MLISLATSYNPGVLKMQKTLTARQDSSFQAKNEQTVLPKEIIEDLVDGILILTEQRDLVYANDYIQRTLRQLNQGQSLATQVPEEIWNVCQVLIRSHHLFPDQHWLIESKIFMGSSIAFNIRAKWLKLEDFEQPCIWLSICGQCQYTQGIVNEESQKYGLTSREKEVWLLHRANYTYKQAALELHITPNTVKKHLKSIYSKQKILLESQHI